MKRKGRDDYSTWRLLYLSPGAFDKIRAVVRENPNQLGYEVEDKTTVDDGHTYKVRVMAVSKQWLDYLLFEYRVHWYAAFAYERILKESALVDPLAYAFGIDPLKWGLEA